MRHSGREGFHGAKHTVVDVETVTGTTTTSVAGAAADVMKQLQAELILLGGTVAR
jgi:hypothetical protein